MGFCDVCGLETNQLSDYFSLLCPNCRAKNYDINFLRKIAVQKEMEIDMKDRNLDEQKTLSNYLSSSITTFK